MARDSKEAQHETERYDRGHRPQHPRDKPDRSPLAVGPVRWPRDAHASVAWRMAAAREWAGGELTGGHAAVRQVRDRRWRLSAVRVHVEGGRILRRLIQW